MESDRRCSPAFNLGKPQKHLRVGLATFLRSFFEVVSRVKMGKGCERYDAVRRRSDLLDAQAASVIQRACSDLFDCEQAPATAHFVGSLALFRSREQCACTLAFLSPRFAEVSAAFSSNVSCVKQVLECCSSSTVCYSVEENQQDSPWRIRVSCSLVV